MNRVLVALIGVAIYSSVSAETRYGFVQVERLEYRDDSNNTLWDVQTGYGGDYHAFRLKTEGELDGGAAERAELQLLYNRAWTAYFDLQFGIRLADFDDSDVAAAVAGIQGMAPYRVEMEATAFLSDDGDLSFRGEFERDFLLNEQLILQPRAEINVAFQDVPEIRVGSGLTELAIGLRLRYEFSRRFAPYLGAEWQRSFGDTADIIRALGQDTSDTTLIAGVRFWF
ncbi:MAG: copper resistance protein B [Gammaproteobacteria bacterium]|nr:copper resistance protein B [Gammaproteobacteria bacterium]